MLRHRQVSTYKSGSPLAVELFFVQGMQFMASENDAVKNLVTAFTAFPGGVRNNNGNYNNIGKNGNFWSASENNNNNAWNRGLNYDNSDVNRNNNNKKNGFSIRCVRDLFLNRHTNGLRTLCAKLVF